MGKFYSLVGAVAFTLLGITFSSKAQAQCANTITTFPFTESFESGFGTLWSGDLAAGVGGTFPGWQVDNNGTLQQTQAPQQLKMVRSMLIQRQPMVPMDKYGT